jgi:hypothetical protein
MNLTDTRWTIVRELPPADRGRRRALAQCACGTVREVGLCDVLNGKSRSCGCLKRDLRIAKNLTHGQSKSSEYGIWNNMIQRCGNPNNTKYADYGGRGIRVCARWLASFENFYADMGPRPSGLTLDRIDVNGNYEPGNCRWATWSEQAANKRPMLICRAGLHEFTPENTFVDSGGWRGCRACRRENQRRQDAARRAGRGLANGAKTHCPQGHEYTPENTYLRPDGGGRDCLTCRRKRDAKSKAARRATANREIGGAS